MFDFEAFIPNADDLDKLAQSMTRTSKFFPGTETFNGITALKTSAVFESPGLLFEFFEASDKDLEDSIIPAGYSYLGQFILHDISFDEKSDRFTPMHYPWNMPLQPIRNKRNPLFDLETIYGEGKVPDSHLIEENSSRLKLGVTLGNETSIKSNLRRSYPNDLLRYPDNVKTDIVDPRNDENLLLAQTQVAFTKFHNAIVHKLGDPNSMAVFEQARQMTIRHYQYIILTDFLPRIVQEKVLRQILSELQNEPNKFYRPTKDDMFIPLEFAIGAYRTSHSMIRHSYHLNNEVKNARLSEIFRFTERGKMNGSGSKLPSRWVINWKWFYDIDDSKNTDKDFFNFARKIDTKYSSSLGMLVPGVTTEKANSLSALDLYRGVAWRLPTGQVVAEKMAEIDSDIRVLTSDQIENNFDEQLESAQRKIFKENTPLLFYLLTEATEHSDGETLGDAGSRIVAETFIKLLSESPYSILQDGHKLEDDKDFLPNDPEIFKLLGLKDEKKFGMAEMLKFIASMREEVSAANIENFDELNPLG